MPVIVGANGTISYSFRKYLSNTPGKHGSKGATGKSHTGHCTHNSASANVKVQKI